MEDMDHHGKLMRNLESIHQDLKANLRVLNSMLADHAEEMRDIKAMQKRQQRFAEEQKRNRRLHHSLIRGLKDKSR